MTLARLLALYAVYGLMKRVVPVHTLARQAWRPPRAHSAAPAAAVTAPVVRLAQIVGTDRGDCVQLALVGYRELSRAGLDPVLLVGLASDGKAVNGHAWVEVEGRPVIEPASSIERFVPTIGFGTEGKAVPIGRG